MPSYTWAKRWVHAGVQRESARDCLGEPRASSLRSRSSPEGPPAPLVRLVVVYGLTSRMANYRHIVRLPYTSGVAEDASVNVWHSISDDDVEAAGFADLLVTFYQAIDTHFSALLSVAANACTVTTYDLADPTPRVPIDVQSFTIVTGALQLPPEVALCLSFQGIRISGLPQARRRGRVYLGPLADNAQDTGGRPTGTVISAVVAAADALLGGSVQGTSGIWAVYSPTNDQTVPVNNGWVDNEFDTIRDRGRRATARTTFS